MKYKIIVSISLVFSSLFCYGQCPEDPYIELFTQQQVNDFAKKYPKCNQLKSLLIKGRDIIDLSPLSGITSIEESINLIDLSIPSLKGVHNIELAGNGIVISRCRNLRKIQSIKLHTAGGVFLSSNDNLVNIDGFKNLVKLEGFTIEQNPKLKNLNGLRNLNEATVMIQVENNPVLADISALGKITKFEIVSIIGNPLLTNCAIAAVCHNPRLSSINIKNNGKGCASIEEVKVSCGSLPKQTLTPKTVKSKPPVKRKEKSTDINDDDFPPPVTDDNLKPATKLP